MRQLLVWAAEYGEHGASYCGHFTFTIQHKATEYCNPMGDKSDQRIICLPMFGFKLYFKTISSSSL